MPDRITLHPNEANFPEQKAYRLTLEKAGMRRKVVVEDEESNIPNIGEMVTIPRQGLWKVIEKEPTTVLYVLRAGSNNAG